MTAQLSPSLEQFRDIAKRGNVIPVFTEFVADGETPISAFQKLSGAAWSFLFESTEKNDVSGASHSSVVTRVSSSKASDERCM